MARRILTDASLCTDCRICQLACSFEKTGLFNPRYGRLRVVCERDGLLVRPVVCGQCENARCVRVCPTEAARRNEYGTIVISEQSCSGCGECVGACPFGLVRQLASGIACKCDLCPGRTCPACVAACPTGALRLVEAVVDVEAEAQVP